MKTVCVILTLGLLAAAAPLAAQGTAPARDGFYFGIATGWGTVGYSCDGCEDTDRVWGSAGNLRLGVAVSPNILIGAGLTGWVNWWDSDGIDYLRSAVLAEITFYPSPAPSGFWIALGGGYGFYGEKLEPDEISINGFEGLARLGYDFRVANNFSVSPYGEFGISFGGSLILNDTDTEFSANTNMINLGVSVMFH